MIFPFCDVPVLHFLVIALEPIGEVSKATSRCSSSSAQGTDDAMGTWDAATAGRATSIPSQKPQNKQVSDKTHPGELGNRDGDPGAQ